ncbi:MAG: hypothetical protein LC118_08710 [Dehalococcoidia bacterium]|nr:hypothetical protein [Dehalococcoidia bacterium]
MTEQATTHPLVEDYMRSLGQEAATLPRSIRQELLREIRAHIGEALASGERTDAEVRNVLGGLGDPHDIAAAARPEGSPIGSHQPGLREAAALLLLLLGGIVPPVLGWFIGVALLWSSSAWTSGQKLLGTLVVPGGLLVPFLLLSMASPVGSVELLVGVPLLGALVLAPIAVVVYLWRVAFRTG